MNDIIITKKTSDSIHAINSPNAKSDCNYFTASQKKPSEWMV